ncbi:MAG: peptidoglycan-binding domain-containing protein [Candidatus Binatia bacterium]
MGARCARAVACLLAPLFVSACPAADDAERQRASATAIAASLVDVDATALAQPADPDTIAEVQRQLAALGEYQGDINGRLDAVLVNAIQAFQRGAGLADDGLLTAETRRRLGEAAAAPTGAASSAERDRPSRAAQR